MVFPVHAVNRVAQIPNSTVAQSSMRIVAHNTVSHNHNNMLPTKTRKPWISLGAACSDLCYWRTKPTLSVDTTPKLVHQGIAHDFRTAPDPTFIIIGYFGRRREKVQRHKVASSLDATHDKRCVVTPSCHHYASVDDRTSGVPVGVVGRQTCYTG